MVPVRTAVLLAVAAIALVPATPARSGTDKPAGRNCVGEEEGGEARAADDEGDGPPEFSGAFYARTMTLDASLDGLDGGDLPISIEEVCDLPKAFAKQAGRLAGGDGVVRVRATTTVAAGGRVVTGRAAMNALASADTALVRKARLRRPRLWAHDEDGDAVPTFTARRIELTD